MTVNRTELRKKSRLLLELVSLWFLHSYVVTFVRIKQCRPESELVRFDFDRTTTSTMNIIIIVVINELNQLV